MKPPLDALVAARISRSALRHNMAVLARAAGGASLCAMVKANAYGHGLPVVARALAGQGLAFWGVATVDEGLELRAAGAREPILVLRPLGEHLAQAAFDEQADAMARHGLRATLADAPGLERLLGWARRRGRALAVHLKVDTGMNRNGCPAARSAELARRLARHPGLRLEGIYTHFAESAEPPFESAERQAAVFRRLLSRLSALGLRVPLRHMANSGAVFNLPRTALDMVRPGIALYGYGQALGPGGKALRPVLELRAPVILVKRIRRGEACGYGGTFVARRPTRLGLLPVGYADGYDRRWSNAGWVSAAGRLVPVAGRVSMDLTILDLTDVPSVGLGSSVCVISACREDPHSVESMARRLGTIPHEITCRLGPRVARVPAP